MASIDLPRALQDYFAFAETTPTRNGRRFSITLPYRMPDGRLERLQWWYHLSAAKEMALGDNAPETLRAEAVERFSVHIERWLQNTSQDLYGNGAIPYVSTEGNRVVAAFKVDPSMSAGLEHNGDVDVPSTEHDVAEADSVEATDASAASAANENEQTGDDTPQSDHHPANRSAFG